MRSGRAPPGEDTLDVVEEHLRRLDGATLAALVADLWTARGYETRVEGAVVVARRSAGSERDDEASGESRADDVTRIGVVAGGRSGVRGRSVPERPVDVLVVAGSGQVDRGEAELVTLSALADLLRYGIPRGPRDRLCERHLGAPPAALSMPLSARVRERGPTLARRVAVAVAVVTLVGAATVPLLFGLGTSGTAAPAVDEATTTPSADRGASHSVPTAATVPGLGPEGITNLSALEWSHRRSLLVSSYSLWIDVYRSGDGNPSTLEVQRDVDVAVDGTRFLATTTVERPFDRRRIRSVYDTGNTTYVAEWDGANRTIRTLRPGELPLGRFGSPSLLRDMLVRQYLSVRRSNVTGRTTWNDWEVFRVTGTGAPREAQAAGVRNYTVEALIDRYGMVRTLTARFDLQRVNGTVPMRIEIAYSDLGVTTLARPDWVPPANGTTVSARTGGVASAADRQTFAGVVRMAPIDADRSDPPNTEGDEVRTRWDDRVLIGARAAD